MKKNTIVNIIVALLLIGGVVWIYNYQMKNFNRLTAQKEAEIKKNAVIEQISKSEKKIFAYKRILTRKEVSALTGTINTLAKNNKVKITSINPLNEDDRDAYIKQNIRLEVNVKSYHDLGNFISALEKSPEIFVVDNLGVVPTTRDTGVEGLKANLMLSTYIYKD